MSEERTPAERRILNEVEGERGEEFADEHAKLIIDQARLIGEL